jgi:MFS family permease
MFDGLEMGLFPLVARPALRELFGPGVGEDKVGLWFSVITAGFLVGAATGGVLFGWLGDKVGRVRAMTLSVLVYAGCSGACAFATAPWQLALLRFAGALGMGGEWALGVALVMELWPNARRGWLAGWIGAFGNLGYAIVGTIAYALNRVRDDVAAWLARVGLADDQITWLTANGNWRLLMLVGALPAVLTLFIRLFVPESDRWERERAAGKASHWSGYDLLAVLIGAVAAAGVIAVWARKDDLVVRLPVTVVGLIVVTAGYLFPARQYLSRATSNPAERRHTLGRMLLGAGLSGVPLLATWAGVMWMYNFVDDLTKDPTTGKSLVPDARPLLMMASAFGAAGGCLVGAVLGDRFGRRVVYAVLCVMSLVVLLGFYGLNTAFGWELVVSGGVVGAVTAAFYGWLPLYLPELFRTEVRASGQGFAYNFGRIIAAVGSLQTGALLAYFDNDYAKACVVTAGVYLIGLVLIATAPETKGKPLPE